MRKLPNFTAATSLMIILLGSCSKSSTDEFIKENTESAAKITYKIDMNHGELNVSQKHQFEITKNGQQINKEVIWRVSDNFVGEIDSLTGLFTAKKVGKLRIGAYREDKLVSESDVEVKSTENLFIEPISRETPTDTILRKDILAFENNLNRPLLSQSPRALVYSGNDKNSFFELTYTMRSTNPDVLESSIVVFNEKPEITPASEAIRVRVYKYYSDRYNFEQKAANVFYNKKGKKVVTLVQNFHKGLMALYQ